MNEINRSQVKIDLRDITEKKIKDRVQLKFYNQRAPQSQPAILFRVQWHAYHPKGHTGVSIWLDSGVIRREASRD